MDWLKIRREMKGTAIDLKDCSKKYGISLEDVEELLEMRSEIVRCMNCEVWFDVHDGIVAGIECLCDNCSVLEEDEND